MKVSACWIVKNESKNLRRSIESFNGVVDELVVVDTGSTDDTVDIAKSLGARVEHFEWIGDFSAARNYTMSQVTGEIMFFIDADEWFSPKLTPEDRENIEKVFLQHPEIDAIHLTSRNLNSQGAVKSTNSAGKIMRNKPELKYQGKIHEQLRVQNGDMPKTIISDSWQLDHCGHAEDVIQDKMDRNIKLLEVSAENSSDPMERHFHHCYLVRECYQRAEFDDSARHLRFVLDEPDMIRRQCIQYDHGFASLMYSMLFAAADVRMRPQVSRKEIHRKLIEPFRRYIRQYPGLATIELLYKSLFDIKEDVILSQITSAMEAARSFPESPISNFREAEMIINQCAAEASLLRGKLTEAMNYAVESFKYTQNTNHSSLRVLLSCMRGISSGEIIFFLNSQFDLNNPARLEYLSTGTRIHGFQEVHAYYLDKRIQAGLATKGDYLYLLLMCGRYGESAETARQLYNDDTADIVSRNLFLASICSGDEQIYRANENYLTNYKHILDAYFSGGGMDAPTMPDFEILGDNYGLIALAAGMEKADRFMGLFESQKLLCFQVKAKYCVENGLYEPLLTQVMPFPDDMLSNHYVIEALTITGRCEEAFDKIDSLLGAGCADSTLLRFLLAAADRSSGEQKRRLNAVYTKYSSHYDLFVDMQDILHTGYVIDDGDKKKAKAYKSLTYAQFNKQLSEDAEKPPINGFAQLSEQVGAIYEEKGMPAAALECYRFSLAQKHNEAENRKKLASLFRLIGNGQLAAGLESVK